MSKKGIVGLRFNTNFHLQSDSSSGGKITSLKKSWSTSRYYFLEKAEINTYRTVLDLKQHCEIRGTARHLIVDQLFITL